MNQEHLFWEDEAIKLAETEYQLGFIDGNFGSGKTAFLAYIAYESQKDYKRIYSNFELNIKNSVFMGELDRESILRLNPKREKCLMVLQESYNYFDKRYCMKKGNKGIQTALFQIRKLNVDILCDIPKLHYLDFRSIDNANMYFHSLGEVETNHKKTGQFIYQSINEYDQSVETTFCINMREIFDKEIYDTYEKTIPKSDENEKKK